MSLAVNISLESRCQTCTYGHISKHGRFNASRLTLWFYYGAFFCNCQKKTIACRRLILLAMEGNMKLDQFKQLFFFLDDLILHSSWNGG